MKGLCRQNGIYTICTRHPKNAWHRDLTNGKNWRKHSGKGEREGERAGGQGAGMNLLSIIPSVFSKEIFSL